jgi:hypothetical protein
MRVSLWKPKAQNGGWVTFRRDNLRRFDWGRKDGCIYWWAIFGFTGWIMISNWPWQGGAR